MKKILILFVFIISALLSVADNVEFSANAPARVGLNQNFHLQYTTNQQGSISLGNISGFKIVGGPSISTSQNIQIINNQYSQKTTYTYTYTLQASQKGNFTIPPATITIDGKTHRSNQVVIEVTDQAVAQNRRQQAHDPWANFFGDPYANQQQTPSPQEITADDLYVRIHVDKSNLYRGEHLIASVKLYSKVDIIGFEEMNFPPLNGFWVEEMESPQRINLQREVINGQAYNVGLLKQYVLFPRHSGEIKIEACELKCQVRQAVRGGRSLMDQFFGQYQTITKAIKSPEVTINVKNLPSNNSADFKGAVGSYSISAKLSRDTLIVNEALSLTLTVKGNGNLRMVEQATINFPKEFEVYEPQTINNFSANTGGVSGSKTWDYTIIPRYPGIFELGQIKFEFFDTQSKQFKSVLTENIIIAVRKDAQDQDFGKTVYNYNQRSIDYIGDNDIRFIKTSDLNLKQSSNLLITEFKYKVLYIASLLLFLSFIVVKRKQIKENSNLALIKNKRANKISRKRLKLAKKHMIHNQKSEFYKEIINALWGYLSDKLSIEIAELNRDIVATNLSSKQIDSLLTDRLFVLIDNCEYAHFAPSAERTNMEAVYNEAIEIINLLEQKLK